MIYTKFVFLEREGRDFVITYDYVTKETIQSDPNDTSGEFAFNAMGVKTYNYNPQQAFVPMQQPQQQFTGAPMNTPVYNPQLPPYMQGRMFVGAPYNPQGGMSQPTGMYNPWTQQAFHFQQPQPVQDKVVHVEGYNPFGSRGLLPDGIEAKCDQLQLDTMLEQEKVLAEREKRIQGYYVNNGYYNNYYNYYGNPYMNTMDQGVFNRYVDQVKEIANAAIQSRINFNKNLSRLVHKFIGDDITEEDIDRTYDGYTYTIPGTTVKSYETQDRLEKCIPVDNSRYYQQQFNLVSQMYQSIMPETDNLNDYLHNCGYLIMEDNIEQHLHNLKDSSKMYMQDTFHMYLRRYAKDNEIKQRQDQVVEEVRNGNNTNLPTNRDEALRLVLGDAVAKEVASFRQKMESGFVPIGPPDNNGTPVVMTDQLENEFEMRRGAFVNSIYNNMNHAQEIASKGVT